MYVCVEVLGKMHVWCLEDEMSPSRDLVWVTGGPMGAVSAVTLRQDRIFGIYLYISAYNEALRCALSP